MAGAISLESYHGWKLRLTRQLDSLGHHGVAHGGRRGKLGGNTIVTVLGIASRSRGILRAGLQNGRLLGVRVVRETRWSSRSWRVSSCSRHV
jgi:hypothetical protein